MADHFKSVHFKNYKALKNFSIQLNEFNVLVGPNNAGKSTIIGAFRFLSEGLRKAKFKSPEHVHSLKGLAYNIPLDDIPIATENIFSDYDDSEPATIDFNFSSGARLQLYFPDNDLCYLICHPLGKISQNSFRFQAGVRRVDWVCASSRAGRAQRAALS